MDRYFVSIDASMHFETSLYLLWRNKVLLTAALLFRRWACRIFVVTFQLRSSLSFSFLFLFFVFFGGISSHFLTKMNVRETGKSTKACSQERKVSHAYFLFNFLIKRWKRRRHSMNFALPQFRYSISLSPSIWPTIYLFFFSFFFLLPWYIFLLLSTVVKCRYSAWTDIFLENVNPLCYVAIYSIHYSIICREIELYGRKR